MKRIAMGAVSGLAIWLGSALAAEAQVIQPTGPMKVTVTDTSEVYTATITTNSSFTIILTVTNNGTQVYTNQWYITNSGPSYNFQSPSLSTSTWGLAVGDTIDFHATVVQGLHRVNSDYYLTVQPAGTSMILPSSSDSMMVKVIPSTKGDIEERFAWDDRRNA